MYAPHQHLHPPELPQLEDMALLKKRDRHLGVDISPTAVKLVELNRSGHRLQVEAMAVEPLPEGSMEDQNPTDTEAVAAAIKRALKQSGSRLRQAAVAVPTSSVITRIIPMPLELGEEEIETNIQIEAAQYIPFPLEEIYLDFQVMGRSNTHKEMQDVMIVASRRENVDLREEVLSEAGLKAALVDVESYALENTFGQLSTSLPDYGQEARIALVDLGATVTALYVFQNGELIYNREQPFGGDQLTQAIVDTYELPRDRAELAKRSGELSEDYSSAVLAPYRRSAAEQIGHALQFFFSSSHHHDVDHILLVGGGALVDAIDQTVTQRLKVPTTIGNPYANMGISNRLSKRGLLKDAPLFAVACGLALRSFD